MSHVPRRPRAGALWHPPAAAALAPTSIQAESTSAPHPRALFSLARGLPLCESSLAAPLFHPPPAPRRAGERQGQLLRVAAGELKLGSALQEARGARTRTRRCPECPPRDSLVPAKSGRWAREKESREMDCYLRRLKQELVRARLIPGGRRAAQRPDRSPPRLPASREPGRARGRAESGKEDAVPQADGKAWPEKGATRKLSSEDGWRGRNK